jgi:hypothetical protein
MKAPEIDGKRKQYSEPEDRWLFGNFRPFPTGKNRNFAGRHRKNPKKFRSGILLP